MKKALLFSPLLIAADQLIKLLITQYYINTDVTLLPGVLYFRPVQNTNLAWVASIIDFKAPVILMFVTQILGLAVILCAYRYLLFLWGQKKYLLDAMLCFYVAGIACSFIDVAFWGGSWDYIQLFNWFTFDGKDVFLTLGSCLVSVYGGIYYLKKYRWLSKEERKQTDFLYWVKKGAPSSSAR